METDSNLSQLNRVELAGIVGSARIMNVGGTRAAQFSVATSRCYKDSQGTVTIDTTWLQATAFEGAHVRLDGLQKGSRVHLLGRLRNTRYTAQDGTERSTYEVVAHTLEILPDDVPFPYENQ